MPDLLTVVERVTHRPNGAQATQNERSYTLKLATREQPYERRCEATPQWQPLEFGWLRHESVGMLYVINDEGKFHQRNPTEEERRAVEALVLEVGIDTAPIRRISYVPVGATVRLFPVAGDGQLMLRCQSGVAKYTLVAYPK